MNESQLVQTIKAHIAKGDKAADKAEQHYIAAGQHLKTLKEQHKGTWDEWEALLKQRIGIGKSRASELMLIADGTKTLAQVRAESAERKQQERLRDVTEKPGIEMPEVSISEPNSKGEIEVKIVRYGLGHDGRPIPECNVCGDKSEAITYKCPSAESALRLVRAYTDPEIYRDLQEFMRAWHQAEDHHQAMARYLLNNPETPDTVAGWLQCDPAWIEELLDWARGGFKGPFPPE
jgi:hypothetical protein